MGKLFNRKKENETGENVGEAVSNVQELSDDVMDQVSGAGDPFKDIPRVPTNSIDDALRQKG